MRCTTSSRPRHERVLTASWARRWSDDSATTTARGPRSSLTIGSSRPPCTMRRRSPRTRDRRGCMHSANSHPTTLFVGSKRPSNSPIQAIHSVDVSCWCAWVRRNDRPAVPAYRETLLDACRMAITMNATDLLVRGALANSRGAISESGAEMTGSRCSVLPLPPTPVARTPPFSMDSSRRSCSARHLDESHRIARRAVSRSGDRRRPHLRTSHHARCCHASQPEHGAMNVRVILQQGHRGCGALRGSIDLGVGRVHRAHRFPSSWVTSRSRIVGSRIACRTSRR